ncbi:MAG: cytochrome c [Rhodospirillaceae bacterium]|nr:cytochrome c [Rhodospirillaceae bacterium]
MRIASLFLAAAFAAGPAAAQEGDFVLKKGPGLDAVESGCGSCHTLDYIRINSPFMNEKVWTAEVNKMIKVFGAPIEPAAARTIIDYLVKHYGKAG